MITPSFGLGSGGTFVTADRPNASQFTFRRSPESISCVRYSGGVPCVVGFINIRSSTPRHRQATHTVRAHAPVVAPTLRVVWPHLAQRVVAAQHARLLLEAREVLERLLSARPCTHPTSFWYSRVSIHSSTALTSCSSGSCVPRSSATRSAAEVMNPTSSPSLALSLPLPPSSTPLARRSSR